MFIVQNAAQLMVEQLKIRSQKDRALLDAAKKEVYKQGFYNGTLLVGEFSGKPVQEVKNLVRELLLSTNQAIKYCEPESPVYSRSGDLVRVTYKEQLLGEYSRSLSLSVMPNENAWPIMLVVPA